MNRLLDKLLSGRYVLTLVCALVFGYCAAKKISFRQSESPRSAPIDTVRIPDFNARSGASRRKE